MRADATAANFVESAAEVKTAWTAAGPADATPAARVLATWLLWVAQAADTAANTAKTPLIASGKAFPVPLSGPATDAIWLAVFDAVVSAVDTM